MVLHTQKPRVEVRSGSSPVRASSSGALSPDRERLRAKLRRDPPRALSRKSPRCRPPARQPGPPTRRLKQVSLATPTLESHRSEEEMPSVRTVTSTFDLRQTYVRSLLVPSCFQSESHS